MIAEHVDTRYAKSTVTAHSIPNGLSLVIEGAFSHHMAGEGEAVFPAPVADVLTVISYKKIREQILKTPAYMGELTIGKPPEKL